jgi:hypothetical protein
MGDFGMTSPKPGPITALTNTVQTSESGTVGDDMGDDLFSPANNPPKSMLGGDNRQDLGLFAVRGNPPPEGALPHDSYDWPGDYPLFKPDNNATRDDVKSWFRGGSDTLGMDGRTGGS